jgi:hypothetical protein
LVDVTIRRNAMFQPGTGERVTWSFGGAKGSDVGGKNGLITVRLAVTETWQTLVLTRERLQAEVPSTNR